MSYTPLTAGIHLHPMSYAPLTAGVQLHPMSFYVLLAMPGDISAEREIKILIN